MTRLVLFCVAVLLPIAAHASFNGPLCYAGEFRCHWALYGLILGAVGGIPVSCVTFAVLHVYFRHPARVKGQQFLLGLAIGAVAFEVWALIAAALATWVPAPQGAVGVLGLLATLIPVLLMMAGSVRYVRSAPRGAAPTDDT